MPKSKQLKLTTRAIAKVVGNKLEIEAPYNARFVSQLNHDIPQLAKQWIADVPCTDSTHHGCRGRWRISLNHKQEAIDALKAFYPIVVLTDINGTHTMKWQGVA